MDKAALRKQYEEAGLAPEVVELLIEKYEIAYEFQKIKDKFNDPKAEWNVK